LRGSHQEHLDRLDLHQGAALGLRRKRGAKAQAIGPSRGGQTTKVHALTDTVGRPFALTLTPGNVADVTVAPVLLARARGARYVLADKGYDADALRRAVRKAGAVPVIPGRSTRKRRIVYDRSRYRERHLIENAFCRLKDFRRIATRYDKLARNFLSAVALAAILAFWI
jgi:transposase